MDLYLTYFIAIYTIIHYLLINLKIHLNYIRPFYIFIIAQN